MHVLVGGIPANDECSTDVWQYRQSMPRTPTWCSWLKGTGCTSATPASVPYDERVYTRQTHIKKAKRNREPKMLTREKVFVLGWKTWGIGASGGE